MGNVRLYGFSIKDLNYFIIFQGIGQMQQYDAAKWMLATCRRACRVINIYLMVPDVLNLYFRITIAMYHCQR